MKGIYEKRRCVKKLALQPENTGIKVLVRLRMGGLPGSAVLKNCSHLNCSDARFKTFVAVFASRSLQSLVEIISGEYTENNRL
jgi:hypothetical protein